MGIKELIASVLEAIEKLPADEPSLHPIIRIESLLSYAALMNFLKEFSPSTLNPELNKKTMQRFCDFLSDRWRGIRHTDSAYPYHRHTKANRAYIIFAEYLAEAFRDNYMLQPYELLMPTVTAGLYQLSRQKLDDFGLQEFILSDEGIPIEIERCLEQARINASLRLAHTSLNHKLLNDQETDRVIHHSEATEEYFDALQFYLQTGCDNDLKVARINLHLALQEKNDYVVQSTYGKDGMQKLANLILQKISNPQSFINLMHQQIKIDHWGKFLSYFEANALIKLFLEDDSFINAVQKRKNYTGDAMHDRAFLFVLAEIYRRQLSLTAETAAEEHSFFSRFNRRYLGRYRQYLGGFTRNEEIAAVAAYQSFLQTELPLYALTQYLDQQKLSKEQRAPLYAMMSQLAFLVEQTERVSYPDYFQKKSSRFLGFLGF